METTNEELQSTNQELGTINDELRDRTQESTRLSAFLEAILAGLDDGVVVLDREMRVHLWNRHAEEQWGLRRDEVLGKNLFSLDVGLPVERLRQPFEACLANADDDQQASLEAINRRGKTVEVRIRCTPLTFPGGEVQGVILVMEEVGQ